MFAVVKAGGKQYTVASNDLLKVEKLDGNPGDIVTLDVISVGSGSTVAVGTPLVSGAKVTAEILSHGKADKVVIFKKKRRQNYRRTRGHRQQYTALFITEIVNDKGEKSSADMNKKPKYRSAADAAPQPKKAKVEKTAKPAAAKKAAAPKAAKPAAEKKASAAKAPKAEGAAKPAAKKTPAKKEPKA